MREQSFDEVLEERGAFLWKSVGISMRPLIVQGRDYIYIRRIDRPLEKYDVVLFKRPPDSAGGRYVLHRILKKNPDGTYWIVGDNCFSGETVQEGNILGILSSMVRKGENTALDSFRYKLYVHMWCDFYPVRFFILRYKSYLRKLLRMIRRKWIT